MDEEEEKINLFAFSSSEEEDFLDDSAMCLSEIPTVSRSSMEREQSSNVTGSDPATDTEDSQTGRTVHTEEFGSSFHDDTEKSYDLNCEEEESTITHPNQPNDNQHPTPSEDGRDTHSLHEVNIEELDLNSQEAESSSTCPKQPDESQHTTQLVSSDDNRKKQEQDILKLDLNSKEEEFSTTGAEEPGGKQHTTQLVSVDNSHPAQNSQEIKTAELDLHSKDKVSSTTYPKQPGVIQDIAKLISSMKDKQPQSPQERKILKLAEKFYRDSLKIVLDSESGPTDSSLPSELSQQPSTSASTDKKEIRQVNYLLPLQLKGINLSTAEKNRLKRQLKKVYKTFEDEWIEKTTPKLTDTADKNPPKISATKQKLVPNTKQVNRKPALNKSREDIRRNFLLFRQQVLHPSKKQPTPATITRAPVLYGKQDHSQNKNLQSYVPSQEIKNVKEKSKRTYSPHEIDTFRKSFFEANDTKRVKRLTGEEPKRTHTTYESNTLRDRTVTTARHNSERRRRSPDEEPRRTRSVHDSNTLLENSYRLPSDEEPRRSRSVHESNTLLEKSYRLPSDEEPRRSRSVHENNTLLEKSYRLPSDEEPRRTRSVHESNTLLEKSYRLPSDEDPRRTRSVHESNRLLEKSYRLPSDEEPRRTRSVHESNPLLEKSYRLPSDEEPRRTRSVYESNTLLEKSYRLPSDEEPRRTRLVPESNTLLEKSYRLPPNVTSISSDLNRMETLEHKSIESARASYAYRETFSRTPSALTSDDVNNSHTREKRLWAETLDIDTRRDVEDFFSSPLPKIPRGSIPKDMETRRLDGQSDNFERKYLQTQPQSSNESSLRTYPPSASPSRSASGIKMSGAMRRKIIKAKKMAEGTWLGRNAYQVENNNFKPS